MPGVRRGQHRGGLTMSGSKHTDECVELARELNLSWDKTPLQMADLHDAMVTEGLCREDTDPFETVPCNHFVPGTCDYCPTE